MKNPFRMTPPPAGSKMRPVTQALLYLTFCAAGGFLYQAGQWTWDWAMTL
ncbi:hypothetical protein ACIQZO_06085 [Streptomyces sp. NPDC097617]